MFLFDYRLIALYTIRYGKGDKLRNLCKSVKGVSEKEVYDVIETVSKFSRIKSRYLFGDESSASAFTPNFFKGLVCETMSYEQPVTFFPNLAQIPHIREPL